MAISVSSYASDLILEVILGRASFPTTAYVALCITQVDPSWSGTDLAFYEPDDPSYERQPINLDTGMEDVDEGASTNLDDLVWDTPTTEWGRIGYFALCTAATAGQVLFPGELSQSFNVSPGAEVRMQAGSIILGVGSITDYGTDS